MIQQMFQPRPTFQDSQGNLYTQNADGRLVPAGSSDTLFGSLFGLGSMATRALPKQAPRPDQEALAQIGQRANTSLEQAMAESAQRLQSAQGAVPAQPAGLEQMQSMFNQGIASQLPYGQMMQNPYGIQTQFNPYGVAAPSAYMNFGAPAPEAGGDV